MEDFTDVLSNGITEKTPQNVVFGAGTIHKNLKFSGSKWNFKESLIGATSGGIKLEIKPEYHDIKADGATVKVKGLTVKKGESAKIEFNLLELSPDLIKVGTASKENSGTQATGYKELVSKPRLEEGDYYENIGYVGKTLEGKPVIVILDNALCTSGIELEGKNGEENVSKYVFECFQALGADATTLPYHIYFPTEV